MINKLYTLVYVQQGKKVLLGMKKRGFGQGKWNGFGGKVQPEETIETAMIRELHEETGLHATSIATRGVMFSHYPNGDIHEVHAGVVEQVSGELHETEEMRPQWFDIDALPFDQMWPDDKHWLPSVLAGQTVKGNFYFDAQDQLVNFNWDTIAA